MEKKYYFESITLENYRLKRKKLNKKKKNLFPEWIELR